MTMARQFFTRFLPCVALTPAVSAFLDSRRDQFAPFTNRDRDQYAYKPAARKKEFLCLHQKLYALSDESNYGDTDNGKSLQIIKLARIDGKVGYQPELIKENLEMVLLHPDVKDKPVVIVSVAGPFREGPAPLLGFFLKYLATEGSDWLSDDDQIKWYDQEQDLSGIHIWCKPFTRSDKDGQEVAVLLMETRGAIDCKMTADDFAGVFALSSLISSVQIYNIMGQIQEDDLQPLKFLIDLKKMDTEDSDCNQSLLFLMRNWKYKLSYSYGENGGNAYVFDLLHTAEEQHETVKTLRCFFPNIGGCLLPNPGEAIDHQDLRNVQVKEFNAEFKKHMIEFVPSIMAEDKLMSNTIVRRDMKGKDMLEFVQALVSAFENDSTPKSVFEATVKFGRDKAVYDAYEFYAKEMDKFYSDHYGWSTVAEEETYGYHLKMKEEAKKQFDENPRMKIKNTEEESRHELEEKIEKKFQEVKSQINENNSFLSALYYAGAAGAGGAAGAAISLSFLLLL